MGDAPAIVADAAAFLESTTVAVYLDKKHATMTPEQLAKKVQGMRASVLSSKCGL